MSLLRLSCVASKIKERDLKIHFGKPENGGGTINAIMFPMFNDDAVIEFKEKLSKYYDTHLSYPLSNNFVF